MMMMIQMMKGMIPMTIRHYYCYFSMDWNSLSCVPHILRIVFRTNTRKNSFQAFLLFDILTTIIAYVTTLSV